MEFDKATLRHRSVSEPLAEKSEEDEGSSRGLVDAQETAPDEVHSEFEQEDAND